MVAPVYKSTVIYDRFWKKPMPIIPNPGEYTIEATREGFKLVDEFGEDVETTRIYTTHKSAREALDEIVREYLENYDGPPDGEEWSGGFAENH